MLSQSGFWIRLHGREQLSNLSVCSLDRLYRLSTMSIGRVHTRFEMFEDVFEKTELAIGRRDLSIDEFQSSAFT